MVDLKATLTRKVGPLPVWAWGGIAGVGLIVARKAGWIRTKAPAGDSTGAAPDTVADGGPIEPPASVDYWGGDGAALLPGVGGEVLPPGVVALDPGTYSVPELVPAGVRPSGSFVPPCSRPHRQPQLGGYAGAPNRECPQGWHLNRVPLTPCFGYCVEN